MAVDSVSNGNQEQPQKLLLHGWHPDWSGARSQPVPMSHGTVFDPSHLPQFTSKA
jgi:hypothetical protein